MLHYSREAGSGSFEIACAYLLAEVYTRLYRSCQALSEIIISSQGRSVAESVAESVASLD